MKLIDSHCHLNCLAGADEAGGIDTYLERAAQQQVAHFLCVSIDMESYPVVKGLAEQYPQISASVGLHPTHTDGREATVEELVSEAANPNIVAIGETGLDYFRCEGDMEWQRERFRTHIRAARECGKPLIIHTREAREDTIRILQEEGAAEIGGVMHCFTETWEMAEAAMEMGFYVSMSGIVTFKNAESLRDVARRLPADRLLIETDCPYLAPMPHRGKQNEPAYVAHVAERVAQERGVTVEELAQQTTDNFARLFKVAL